MHLARDREVFDVIVSLLGDQAGEANHHIPRCVDALNKCGYRATRKGPMTHNSVSRVLAKFDTELAAIRAIRAKPLSKAELDKWEKDLLREFRAKP
jgi:hypothetical protein